MRNGSTGGGVEDRKVATYKCVQRVTVIVRLLIIYKILNPLSDAILKGISKCTQVQFQVFQIKFVPNAVAAFLSRLKNSKSMDFSFLLNVFSGHSILVHV